MFLVIFGIQGSGKGTQADLLAKKLGIPHLSTGDMLRSIAAEDTPLGHELKTMLDSGQYLDDDRMTAILKERLPEHCILDGYPRTLNQAELLDTIRSVDKVLYVELHEQEAMARMLKRGRSDDTPEAISKRFGQYKLAEEAILDYYRQQTKLVTVNGDQSVEAVFNDIYASLRI